MPYTQLLSMQSSGEHTMPGYYSQDPAINDFGAPSAGSLDSGFDEVDPFDKRSHYHPNNSSNVDFDQACSMSRQRTAPMDFGAFGYTPSLAQRVTTGYTGYPTAELTPSFQPLASHIDPYGRYQASPGLEDVSEDGQTGSMCSNSPRQANFGVDASPQHKDQPSWSSRSEVSKQPQTDSSPPDVKYVSEEQAAPKATPARGRPRKRIPHTAVERRYRENLNAHLERLRAAVPNLTAAQRRKSSDGSDPMKPSKCEVLMGAVDYIKRLETENDRLKRKVHG